MFHPIRQAILERMKTLEEIDRRDRTDGTTRLQRLRQIPAETGKFLALLAASVPQGITPPGVSHSPRPQRARAPMLAPTLMAMTGPMRSS